MATRFLSVCTLAAMAVLPAAPSAAESIVVAAHPVALNPEDASQTRVGKLRFRGGIALTSDDPRFGGLSALGISRDGRRMVALSDHGYRFGARLVYDADGRLVGVRDTDIGAMGGLDGQALRGKRDRDAESMAPGARGEIIVAFERNHRLWRYFPGRATPEPLPPPDQLRDAPFNGGIEALALLADGRLLALTEDFGRHNTLVGWLSRRDGWSVLTYLTRDDFKPTGAATLPGGDVIVLERRFGPLGIFTARLVRIDGTRVAPGAHLRGREVAELAQPLTVDNFEGVEARQGTDGKSLIYIVSDDNFNAWQRTILMMFELTE